jgi:putative peptide zinc metalloprotease protein
LLRAAVAVPVLLLVGVGALFVPTTAPRPPVAELAHWITGPASGGGAVAVPPELWGELLHDGVPPERLVSYGSGSAREAAWTVTVGGPGRAEPPEATFGSDPAALTVRTSSEEEARRFAEETQR